MPTYRITKQTATVIEESFDVEAADEEAAQDAFHEEFSGGDQLDPIHTETINRHWEVVSTEEVTT